MMDTMELIVLNGLEVARRATDQVGECAPTLFVVRGDAVDWAHPVPLDHPRDYVAAAQRLNAPSVVVVWSHAYVDADYPDTRLLQIFAGVINLTHRTGVALKGAKRQRWADSPSWTNPSVLEGPLQLGSEWVM
jgi:hypothetical protein